MIPDNTPEKFVNKDGTLNADMLVRSYLELEFALKGGEKTDTRLFTMTMDHEFDARTVAPYVKDKGFSISQVDEIIHDFKFYWTSGPGAGRRRSKGGWDKALHNRFAQLVKWGKL